MPQHDRRIGVYELGYIAVAHMCNRSVQRIADDLQVSVSLVHGYLSGKYIIREIVEENRIHNDMVKFNNYRRNRPAILNTPHF